jgi:hypothetical protein
VQIQHSNLVELAIVEFYMAISMKYPCDFQQVEQVEARTLRVVLEGP